MDAFADPDRPLPALFPGRTGRGVRVAIIDSGVHPEHPHIDASRIAAAVAIRSDGSIDEGPDCTIDRLGHGTAVTAAILEKAPDVECLPVRVFLESLRTSAAALVTAIRWSIAQQVDIVNLSLGSANAAHIEVFSRVIAEANAAGVAVVAAREADAVPCYPGQIEGVLGVELDWECPRAGLGFALRGERPVLLASGYPRAIPGVARRRNLHGISFAVAQVTAFAALACEEEAVERGPERVEAIAAALRRVAGFGLGIA